MKVAGYDYRAFCQGIAERDGAGCFVRRLLVGRRAALREKWSAGHPDGTDPLCQEWIPAGLFDCRGDLDGHHLLSKSWLKSWHATVVRESVDGCGPDLAAILNDPRNGVLCDRRHHDLLERHLITVRRGDLPSTVEEFAAELGDKALARLDRDYGVVVTHEPRSAA